MSYRKPIAVALFFILALLMGTMHMGMVSHGAEHAHHTATTHSTGICAWMCMAAQSVSTDSPAFTPKFLPRLEEEPSHGALPPSHLTSLLHSSRAPPR